MLKVKSASNKSVPKIDHLLHADADDYAALPCQTNNKIC